MPKQETEYDEHGWKLSVTKNKTDGVVTIRQRSRGGYHKDGFPMMLRLRSEELKKLMRMLSNAKH